MCSETSPPRLSFSHDLGQSDVLPIGHNQPRRDSSLLDLNCDFEFSISSSFRDESCSADELFSDGVILPKQPQYRAEDAPKRKYNGELAKHNYASLPPIRPVPNPPPNENSKKDNMKEELVAKDNQSDSLEQKPQSKSFWGFKRSSSLNQENKKSLLCSLQLLSRSNSTGSSPKKTTFKDANKTNSHKHSSISMSKSSSCSSSSSSNSSNPYTMLPRPPSKKGWNGSSYYGGNGVRISPVLNVPSPYISKGTAKLFCLTSFLHPGKDQKVKK